MRVSSTPGALSRMPRDGRDDTSGPRRRTEEARGGSFRAATGRRGGAPRRFENKKKMRGECQNNSVFSTERGRTAIARVATGHGKGSRLTSMRGTNIVEGCAGDTRWDEVALVRVRVRLCRLTGLHLFFSISPAKDTRVKNPQIYLRLSLVLTWLFLCLVNRPSILGSRWYRLRKTTIRGFIGRDILLENNISRDVGA